MKVTPGAREDVVIGWQGNALRLRVRAAPEAGRANEAVCRLIASVLGLPPRAVVITHGASSREKLVQIEGLDGEEIRRRLATTIV